MMPEYDFNALLRAHLRYAFGPIDYDWAKLTAAERQLFGTKEFFDRFVADARSKRG